MECCFCGSPLSELDYCTNCRADVRTYKKIIYTSNRLYNEGLDRAKVRDLSGAIAALRGSLKCNKNNIQARNLLGLVYYEMGEAVSAFQEWYISGRICPEKNVAVDYLEMVQSNQGKLETINAAIKKYNKAVDYCRSSNLDLAELQLKQILRQNPKYVKAHQLLALLYLKKEEWHAASVELERCNRIDNGDILTRRFQAEVDAHRKRSDQKKGKKKLKSVEEEILETAETPELYPMMSPMPAKEHSGLNIFLEVLIGIVLGAATSYFVLMPTRETKIRDELSAERIALDQEIEARNVEIASKNARIAELEQDNTDLMGNVSSYAGSGGALSSCDQLISAAYAYIDKSQDDMVVEQLLDLISTEYVENDASSAYVELYDYLRLQIGDSVADTYYDEGIDAYRREDYQTAIEYLTKAYDYNTTNDDALYYLALSYLDNGDSVHAEERFQELLSVFPESAQAEKARQRLTEIASEQQ